MILKTVYIDEFGNELECYPTSAHKICLRTARLENPEASNYISLDVEEIPALISALEFYRGLIGKNT